jgi:hypothetical protein
MASDKKNRRAVIHCALPAGIGRMHRSDNWTTLVTREELESALMVIQ